MFITLSLLVKVKCLLNSALTSFDDKLNDRIITAKNINQYKESG
jgi:hypothetical protein